MTQPGENIHSWSKTAASNGSADVLFTWAENMARAAVNDSGRGMMASAAKWRDLTNGTITTGGSANAQTFTSGITYGGTDTIPDGFRARLKAGFSNTAAMTLAMDSVAAAPVKNMHGAALGAGEWLLANYHEIIFFNPNWILLNSSYDNGVAANFTPADPAGMNGLTPVMMGLGSTVAFTPLFSARVLITVSCSLANQTASGVRAALRFGTGTAPVNGAAQTGTLLGTSTTMSSLPAGGGNTIVPASMSALATGLTIGTAYWADLSLVSLTNLATVTLVGAAFSVSEV